MSRAGRLHPLLVYCGAMEFLSDEEAIDLVTELRVHMKDVSRRAINPIDDDPTRDRVLVWLVMANISAFVESCDEVLRLRGIDDVRIGEAPGEAIVTLSLLRDLARNAESMRSTEARIASRLGKRARLLGASWREIGESLGLSPQGAFKRAQAERWMEDDDPLLGDSSE